MAWDEIHQVWVLKLCKQETLLLGPPIESFPINFLYLDCLTKLLAGTSLPTVTTHELPDSKLVGTWTQTETHTHTSLVTTSK